MSYKQLLIFSLHDKHTTKLKRIDIHKKTLSKNARL